MKPGLLKVDQHVKSAEGTRYRVLYVHRAREGQDEQADLAEVHADGSWRYDERLQLPTAELARVAASQRIVVTGVPEGERPRCVKCNKPLAYLTKDTWANPPHRVVARAFAGWKGYHASVDRARPERFCTVACMQWFARRAFDAGYRIVRKQQGEAAG